MTIAELYRKGFQEAASELAAQNDCITTYEALKDFAKYNTTGTISFSQSIFYTPCRTHRTTMTTTTVWVPWIRRLPCATSPTLKIIANRRM